MKATQLDGKTVEAYASLSNSQCYPVCRGIAMIEADTGWEFCIGFLFYFCEKVLYPNGCETEIKEKQWTDQDDAIATAVSEAAKTRQKYYILHPYIANPKILSMIHLVVPMVHQDSLEPGETVALTVFPDGNIRQGKQ